jgi:hypothetical protein
MIAPLLPVAQRWGGGGECNEPTEGDDSISVDTPSLPLHLEDASQLAIERLGKT